MSCDLYYYQPLVGTRTQYFVSRYCYLFKVERKLKFLDFFKDFLFYGNFHLSEGSSIFELEFH